MRKRRLCRRSAVPPLPPRLPRIEPEVDQLYALPPEEFTSARNELAKSLRDGGHKEDADAVRALKKPSVGAWLLNQLARTRAKEVARLVDAGEKLRKVQATGKGDLRAATQEERAAVAQLLEEARSMLEDSGRAPTEAALQPVRTTLAAAAADSDSAAQLRAGRLERELEPPAFGGLLGQLPPPPKRDKRIEAAEQRARQKTLADAKARLARAQKASAQAERRVTKLRGDLEGAEQELDAATAELDAATAELADAKG